jgi:putative FmdB family regulatory protein
MPLFEYRCDKCGKRFTFLVGVTAEKAKLRCPKCGGTKVTKLISRIARVGRGEDDDFDDDFGAGDDELDDSGEDEDLGDLDDE